MTSRSEWALQLRITLLEILSPDGRCAVCGRFHAIENLEVDHTDGRTWYGRRLNFLDRIRRQWREFERGVNLRAACRSCNAADGNRRFHRRPRYA